MYFIYAKHSFKSLDIFALTKFKIKIFDNFYSKMLELEDRIKAQTLLLNSLPLTYFIWVRSWPFHFDQKVFCLAFENFDKTFCKQVRGDRQAYCSLISLNAFSFHMLKKKYSKFKTMCKLMICLDMYIVQVYCIQEVNGFNESSVIIKHDYFSHSHSIQITHNYSFSVHFYVKLIFER